MAISTLELFDFVKDTLLEVKDIDEQAIMPDSELASLDLDSLDYVSIQVALRKKYAISLESDVFADTNLVTMADFIERVQQTLPNALAHA